MYSVRYAIIEPTTHIYLLAYNMSKATPYWIPEDYVQNIVHIRLNTEGRNTLNEEHPFPHVVETTLISKMQETYFTNNIHNGF